MVDSPTRRGPYLWLAGALSVYAALFLIYSQTKAYAWDESYHLIAATLINAGKRPYIDFCFPQTPLNAFWNAEWMRLLGQSWHVTHLSAALFTISAVVLMADFVFFRFPVPHWRLAAAITTGMLTGLNIMVFEYGPLSQGYGICLFALAAAFRCSVRAVDFTGPLYASAAGLFAGIAAASSLLSAAAAPVLLAWILFYNRAGARRSKLIAFGVAGAIPFAPVFWLFSIGPRQAWFNLVQYHLFYRKLYWPDTTRHDFEVFGSWIDSNQGLVLGLLGIFGLFYVVRRSQCQWPPAIRAEFYLCAWLAAGLSIEVGRAHPTFSQYFLLIVPFVAVLAVAGLYGVTFRLFEPDRPLLAMAFLTALAALGLGKATYYEIRDSQDWHVYERLARKVEQVTPRDALLFADEPIYFLTKRTPPPGYELYYSHEVKLPPAEAAVLHILTKADLKRQVQSRIFATAYNCDDDDTADYGLNKLYRQHVEMEGCSIFWDLKK